MTEEKDSDLLITFLRNISLATVLYPLQRIQSVKQIQTTYMDEKLKTNKNIGTLCTHYGTINSFRGFQTYFMRLSTVFFGYNIVNNMKFSNKQLPDQAIKMGIMMIVHLVTYPIENIKIRMSADLNKKRLYQGVADCYSKMKNYQGLRCFYQGFFISFPHIYAQIKLTKFFFQKLTFEKDIGGFQALMYFLPSLLMAEFILYPLDTIKKIIQINGSMGHDKSYTRIRDVIRLLNLSTFYSGFGFRLGLLGLYSGVNLYLQ